MLHVSKHAIERYQERVENIPDEEVKARILTPNNERAAEFAGDVGYIRLATGHRLLIRNGVVISVLPPGHRSSEPTRVDAAKTRAHRDRKRDKDRVRTLRSTGAASKRAGLARLDRRAGNRNLMDWE